LIAGLCAAGLGLSVAAQASGLEKRAPAGKAAHAKLAVLEKPGDHFKASMQIAQRKVERAEASREPAVGTPESVGVSSATLASIAACESGGDPTAVSSDGTYRGLYQFDYGTWASVGGSGDPAAAPAAEQDYRAALLYSQSGSSPWPICGG
jgi:soluble lytic murein transglycosylase-like protein